MKSTKKTFTAAHLATLISGGLGKVDPVPTTGAPAPPDDYVPSKLAKGKRAQPAAALVTAAAAAAPEIGGATTYVTDFGAKAPDQANLAANLAFAAGWSGEYTKAQNWFGYVKEQTTLAWLQTNPILDELGPVFAYARGRDASVSNEYPSTAKLYDVRREPAMKGVAVRASKKAASAAAKKGATPKAPPVSEGAVATEEAAVPTAPPAATEPVSPANGAAVKG
jgi:hypothetical protein